MVDNNRPLIKLNPIPDDTLNALLQPGATSIGEAFKDIVDGIFNLTLGSVRKYNIVKEKDLQDFANEINIELDQITMENRDQSKLGITLKALEDSKYQLHDETMRKLFAKLISKSLDSSKNTHISPIYSQILSNMTPKEAVILEKFFKEPLGLIPCAQLAVEIKGTKKFRFVGSEMLILGENNYEVAPLEFELLKASDLIIHQNQQILMHERFVSRYSFYKKEIFDELVKRNIDNINKEKEEYGYRASHYKLSNIGIELGKLIF